LAPLPAALALLAICYAAVPAVAQTGTGAQRADSASARKPGVFGRIRAAVRPPTSYAGRLLSPILTEATEKGVPGLHVQNAIREFTGPDGDYSKLPEGPANALAERLRKLIREESGQQSRVADSIGTSVNGMAAAVMGVSGPSAPGSSGLTLPADVPAALRAGRLALAGINWSAGDMALRATLPADLRAVAEEMNRLGGPWRIDAAVPQADGGKETARLRTLLVQNALVSAGLLTVNGGKAVLRASKYDEAATVRVEVVRP
jgi:hypothetical protein